ncbi:Ig-like domain-containing protein, partial [Vibrio anguillarum]
ELSILTPVSGQLVTAGDETAIQVSIEGELAAKVEFWVNSQNLGLQNIDQSQTNYSQSWTPDAAGSATIKVLVLDKSNQVIKQQSVFVTIEANVTEDFTAPAVSFITPVNGAMVQPTEKVSVSVRATDVDNDLSTLVVQANGQPICTF